MKGKETNAAVIHETKSKIKLFLRDGRRGVDVFCVLDLCLTFLSFNRKYFSSLTYILHEFIDHG